MSKNVWVSPETGIIGVIWLFSSGTFMRGTASMGKWRADINKLDTMGTSSETNSGGGWVWLNGHYSTDPEQPRVGGHIGLRCHQHQQLPRIILAAEVLIRGCT